jgi:regulator of RNase E activity RraA
VERTSLHRRYSHEAARLYSAVLADVLDRLGYLRQTLPVGIEPLDRQCKLFGRVRTLQMRPVETIPAEPYAMEMHVIDDLSPGEVLVIAMADCPECAVWGELLSTACKARGAAGVVIDGPTRDAERILALGFPTFCRGTTPLDSKGRVDGQAMDVPITIGAVTCRPGDLLCGDRDGVVVIPVEAADAALEAALAKVAGENRVRDELAAGASVREVFAKYGIL